jgi:lipopolysaccharide transport system ATP-binding protein
MTRREITRKFDEIVAFAGVERYIDTPVKRYSSGMYVRLAFAVAAHLESEILIIDEVLAVGDTEFQKKCLGKMGEVSKGEGRTVLFVTHNMASVKSLCTSAMLLHNGKINFTGQTNDVISKYLEENSVFTSINLKDRKDRQGNGMARITDFKIIDTKSKAAVDFTISGNEVSFEIYVLNNQKEVIENVNIGVGLYKNNEEILFNCSSQILDKSYNLIPGLNKITLNFGKWPTSQGTYFVNLFMSNKNGVIDWIEKAREINVESGDFFNTGKVLTDLKNSALIPYWYT